MIYDLERYVDNGETENLYTVYDSVESPHLDLEMNSAGSFSVTLRGYTPKKTAFRDDTYAVYEDGKTLFEGRPTEQERQYDGSVKIYCEGTYAYLQDGIVSPFPDTAVLNGSEVKPDDDGGVTLTAVQAVEYILKEYSKHNKTNRSVYFEADSIDIQGTVYRKFDYEDCMSALSSIQDELGGQMWIDYDTYKKPVLFWMKENSSKWPVSSQNARLGINLTDLSRNFTAGEVTAYLPLGNTIERIPDDDTETKEDDTHVRKDSTLVGQPLTLTNRTDVNNGSDIVRTKDADSLGDVIQVLKLSASTASELLSKTTEYISRQALSQILTNVSVADLHYAAGHEENYEPIRFAALVTVLADYNGETINEDLLCSDMQIDLDSAQKTVSLGTIQRESLSEKQTAADKNIDNTATAVNTAAAAQADTDSKQDDRLSALEDAVKKLQEGGSSSGNAEFAVLSLSTKPREITSDQTCAVTKFGDISNTVYVKPKLLLRDSSGFSIGVTQRSGKPALALSVPCYVDLQITAGTSSFSISVIAYTDGVPYLEEVHPGSASEYYSKDGITVKIPEQNVVSSFGMYVIEISGLTFQVPYE